MTLKPAQRKKTREKLLKDFDPDLRKNPGHIFGLPFGMDESELVVLPVPWDVTSIKNGASEAPEAILKASSTLPLYHPEFPDLWKKGIAMDNIPVKWKESSYELRKQRNKILKSLNKKLSKAKQVEQLQQYKSINYTARLLNEWVQNKFDNLLTSKKKVGLLGGDHSVALGAIRSLAALNKNFGILYLDAHPGLRSKPDGFEFSHDSLLDEIVSFPQVSQIVQVATREVTYGELKVQQENKDKIKVFDDHYIKSRLHKGTTWKILINEIISPLPAHVFISVDADVLKPMYCPNSAKLVPGGLEYTELTSLLTEISGSGKHIIGFGLCGISPDMSGNTQADILTGTHLLYHLSCCALQAT